MEQGVGSRRTDGAQPNSVGGTALLRSFAGVLQQSFCHVGLAYQRFVVRSGDNAFGEMTDGCFEFRPNPRFTH